MKNSRTYLLNLSIIYFTASLLFLPGCKKTCISYDNDVDFSLEQNWAYFPSETSHPIDVFFITPTVYMGDSLNWSMQLDDSSTKENFKGAINMEKGLYDQNSNFYAPYYRQVGLAGFQVRGYNDTSENESLENAFETAYTDVASAFEYYLSQSERPFILAGFSQGSAILIKLIKHKLNTDELQKRHIASYAIGWRITRNEVNEYPHLKPAKSATDLGVVVSFNSEAEFIDRSIFIPDSTFAINPLSWTTDTTLVSKEYNLGACFTNYSGEIENEIQFYTGAYICPKRGALKAVDVISSDYPALLGILPEGVYHLYDYQFFYRNLQANVKQRISRYQELNP